MVDRAGIFVAKDTEKTKDPYSSALANELAALRHSLDALRERIDQNASHQKSSASFALPETTTGRAYVYEADRLSLRSVSQAVAPPLSLLLGVDRAKATLLENTKRFAKGFSANNALLWGARGMGKSTLIKSVFLELSSPTNLNLIEIHREDILSLPNLMRGLAETNARFLVFCDDLSFSRPDRDFKALKSVLEGGLDGRPDNVLFYATSNRRHMAPKTSALDADSLQIQEETEETVALSDRFGLWLGFHACSQADYLAMIDAYAKHFELNLADGNKAALEWAKTRGNRSGRTAWQYIQNLAGEQSASISF